MSLQYLYFHLNILSQRPQTSDYYDDVVGRAVFCVERKTYKYNKRVLDCHGHSVPPWNLVYRIVSLYPTNHYFRRIYYISAFIVDMMIWRYKHFDRIDLSMGPKLWGRIFGNMKFGFLLSGGWDAFTEAGEDILMHYRSRPDEDCYNSEYILPELFMSVMRGYSDVFNIIYPPPAQPVDDVSESIQRLSIETGDAHSEETAEIEEIQSDQDNEQLSPLSDSLGEDEDGSNDPLAGASGGSPCEDPLEGDSGGVSLNNDPFEGAPGGRSPSDNPFEGATGGRSTSDNPFEGASGGRSTSDDALEFPSGGRFLDINPLEGASGRIPDNRKRKNLMKRRHVSVSSNSDPELGSLKLSKAKIDKK